MKLKPIITEVIILIVIYIATWLLVSILTGNNLGSNASLDINMHDTYIVIAPFSITTSFFLMLVTLIYIVKEGFKNYKRNFQNLILITTTFLFLVKIYFLSIFVNSLLQQGWITSPRRFYNSPNATPIPYPKFGQYADIIKHFKQITPAIFIVFMLILVITAILTGKNWNSNKNEQTPA
ncbi:hypothetical protein [Mucilaginibacter sp. SG564]|uniref:hypothetical protein n=1 Tax=unclassified Mucilaginibacter TaxID=2617802 RepID=UPI00155566D7|nr:hypothetical protein [Mucilaginibacter sp. SG564]NOW96704.1 hypothetical protein [Mucilaginibacter sp. SG564]